MPLESFILNQFAFDMFDHVLHIRNGLPAAGRLVLLPALFAGVYACSAATNDWPVYRHDTALSGTAPGKGNITSPVVKWEYYLGAPFVSIARAGPPSFENVADLDGDGTLETFSIEDKRIEVRDSAGKPVWSYTVTGFPLGGNVRVCKLSPNRKDQQIISFSHRMDTGEGQGYCFSFENGVTNGHLLWTTGPLTAQYSPTLVVDDVDGDGLPEIVTAPHYRVQIFDGQTGHLKAEVTEAKGRNYGILLTRSRPDAPQKDIFVLSDFVLHAECVRFENGKWAHAWGKKYFDDENAPRPHGREMYIRVGPNPVSPLIDKRHDQLAYMLVDAQRDDQWHLVVHDAASGNQIADIPGVWVWSISDVNRDGTSEILYTPTKEKRPGTYCDIHVGRLDKNRLEDKAVITNARPVLMTASLPLSMHTIADEGQLDLLHSDDFARGRRDYFFAQKSSAGPFEDSFYAVSFGRDATPKRDWTFGVPGHRLNLVSVNTNVIELRDLTANQTLLVNAEGKVIGRTGLGALGGFSTMPIVADLESKGHNAIIVQNASGEIMALQSPPYRPGASAASDSGLSQSAAKPRVLWTRPGLAMNRSPGYSWNGELCPQAADLDEDAKSEILFATEGTNGQSSLVCADAQGRNKWTFAPPGCPWGGLQAGIDHWTFGHFRAGVKGLDIYVDLHRRSKGSGEGWVLRGDTGEVIWHQDGIAAAETSMPFGGGIPAVADINADGTDDLAQMFYTVYTAINGATGQPLYPPAFLTGQKYFGKWVAYSEPTVASLKADGKPQVYLNSHSYARGGYAAVQPDGTPLWVEFHNNDEGSDGLGPVGDFDGDGKLDIAVPVLNGTLLCLNAADGSHKWKTNVDVTGDVIAADIRGDGIKDLIFATRSGNIVALSGKDGHELWRLPVTGQPIAADVNGDGLLDVVAVGTDGILRVIGQKSR